MTSSDGRLRVRAIAWTTFSPPDDVDWSTDADGGSALAEFAGRACYESWDKPNPATATNRSFLGHLLEVGHLSVLEHASATFYVTGVSRSLTHELIRHRHLSFSQLSQRHILDGGVAVVEPAAIAADPDRHARFTAAVAASGAAYLELLAALEGDPAGDSVLRRKQARQAARAVLPNATETAVVVTGNFRAWRHFLGMRASEHPDVEMRAVAIAVLRELQRLAPAVFADFEITGLPDGTEVASSPFVTEF